MGRTGREWLDGAGDGQCDGEEDEDCDGYEEVEASFKGRNIWFRIDGISVVWKHGHCARWRAVAGDFDRDAVEPAEEVAVHRPSEDAEQEQHERYDEDGGSQSAAQETPEENTEWKDGRGSSCGWQRREEERDAGWEGEDEGEGTWEKGGGEEGIGGTW
jgi:hypothetical protein